MNQLQFCGRPDSSCAGHCPHFRNIRVRCHMWLLHLTAPILCLYKGLPPLRSQGSALRSDPFLRCRSGVDKPLTSFTPLLKKHVSGFLRKPSLSIFSFAKYLAPRGIADPSTPLCFFYLAGARSLRAGGANSVKPCPTIGGHPKGVGLEGIRGASYTLTVPAKQKRVLNLSGTRNKLQVEVFPDYPFDGFGNLTVQSSLKPRDCKTVRYEDCRCCLCYRKERSSSQPVCCLSQR
jgi:hypothetical protein